MESKTIRNRVYVAFILLMAGAGSLFAQSFRMPWGVELRDGKEAVVGRLHDAWGILPDEDIAGSGIETLFYDRVSYYRYPTNHVGFSFMSGLLYATFVQISANKGENIVDAYNGLFDLMVQNYGKPSRSVSDFDKKKYKNAPGDFLEDVKAKKAQAYSCWTFPPGTEHSHKEITILMSVDSIPLIDISYHDPAVIDMILGKSSKKNEVRGIVLDATGGEGGDVTSTARNRERMRLPFDVEMGCAFGDFDMQGIAKLTAAKPELSEMNGEKVVVYKHCDYAGQKDVGLIFSFLDDSLYLVNVAFYGTPPDATYALFRQFRDGFIAEYGNPNTISLDFNLPYRVGTGNEYRAVSEGAGYVSSSWCFPDTGNLREMMVLDMTPGHGVLSINYGDAKVNNRRAEALRAARKGD